MSEIDFSGRLGEIRSFVGDDSFGQKDKRTEWGYKMQLNILEQEQKEREIETKLENDGYNLDGLIKILNKYICTVELVLANVEDTDRKKKVLEYSKQLLEKIARRICELFGIPPDNWSDYLSETKELISKVDAYLNK